MGSVSVFIPCYNYGRYLRECLDSVLGQEGVDVEVLIIDDASSDGSAAIAEELAAGDDRVEVSLHAANRGHIATYNEGLAWARGDHTMLLSADDLLVPGALRRATAPLDAHPEVGFVFGRVITWTDGTPRPAPSPDPGAAQVRDGHEWLANRCRGGGNLCHAATVVTRTSLQRRLGGYRPELPHAGDMEMWLRFAAHGAVGYVHAHQAYARVHPHNMQKQWYAVAVRDLEQRRAAFEVLFHDQGHVIPDADRLHRTATRSLARDALMQACRAVEEGRLDDVDGLVEFASATWAAASHLGEYRRLQWWLRLGPRRAAGLRPFVPRELARTARRAAVGARRQRRGG